VLTPEQHRRASEIFLRVGELPPAERQSALAEACGGDSALRDYVLALISADEQATATFLDQDAMTVAAGYLTHDEPRTGLMLGHYRVGTRIGAGGMGTVYDGYDTRLGRAVAIKLLPSAFTGDRERVQRFEREWRAISLLNHPNIVSLYDAGFAEGHHYIATELVEGQTLRKIGAAGRLSRAALVDLGMQLSSALAAAHGAGVLHRDIKPENIMMRPDGIAKVLDFGLAKLNEATTVDGETALTRHGNLAGTVRYLAPEQVLGKPASAASDLYSVGVVLYELATGVQPFSGPTDGAIFDVILHRMPEPPQRLCPTLDDGVAEILMRLLEKDPDLRFQTAADLRASLRRLSRGESAGNPANSLTAPNRKQRMWWPAAGLLVAGMALVLYWFYGRPSPRTAQRLPIRFERLTEAPGDELFPQLNADGTQFVYASAIDRQSDIFLQRAGGSTPINLTKDSPADDTHPALSRDGSQIAFRSERGEGGIFVMEATGENPRRVSSRGFHPAWSPDGRAIVCSTESFTAPSIRGTPSSRLLIIDLATRTERVLGSDDAIQPSWSPHGHRIAYWGLAAGGQRNVYTISAGTGAGAPVAVTADAAVDWNPVWSPSGEELYFLSDRGGTMNLWRVPIDERSGLPRGEPSPLTVPALYAMHFGLAAGGNVFTFVQAQQETSLYSVAFDEQRQETRGPITPAISSANSRNVYNFSFSADGQQIVHDTVGESQEDIWIADLNGSGRRRLTSDSFKDRSPSWSPVSNEIAFFSDRSGDYDEWVIRADGSGLRQLTHGAHMQKPIWTADGSRILAARLPGAPAFVDPRAAGPVPNPVTAPGLEGQEGLFFWQWPRQGDTLVGEQLMRPGHFNLVLYTPAAARLERLGITGRRPSWLAAGRQFIFTRDGDCLLYDPVLRREKHLFSVAPNRIYAVDASRPGRIYFTQTVQHADVWLGRFAP
jgi:serine/threonine protein kinase